MIGSTVAPVAVSTIGRALGRRVLLLSEQRDQHRRKRARARQHVFIARSL